MVLGVPVVEPWELVYMYTSRLSDGSLIRRLVWHDAGKACGATFAESRAREMGLDILPDTALCAPWVVVESMMVLALSESLTL